MSYILKDGSKVEDKRFDRLISFDERSRNFPIIKMIKQRAPRSYTWKCNGWLDQRNDGACVGFGFAHELIARPVEIKGLTEQFAKQTIYWEAQKIDIWEGGSYPHANPFYEGTTVLAGAKIVTKLGYCEGFRWGFGLDDLIMGVGYSGPAVIGVMWYEEMMIPDKQGYLRKSGKEVGGHCILVNGINIKKERFTIHNSWGKEWANNGEAYISFNDMNKLLKEDGEVVFLVRRKSI